MSELDWKHLLEEDPCPKKGFSNELRYRILTEVTKKTTKPRIISSNKIWVSSLATALVIAAFLIYSPFQTASTNKQSGSSLSSSQIAIQQVQSKVPFQVLWPKSLPDRMSFQNAVYSTNPNNGKIAGVDLNFSSPDQESILVVTELAGSSPVRTMGDVNKSVTINGWNGIYHTDSKQVSLSWTNGKVACMAYTSPNTDFSSEQSMIEIASQFTASGQ